MAVTLAAGAAAGDRTLAVYDPQHRPAAELLPLARVALGAEGEAMVDAGTNQLVLVGTRSALAETVELLRKQDRAPRVVVLRYESQRLDELEGRGLRVDWSAGTGGVRIGNVQRRPASDVDVRARAFGVATEREGGLRGVVRVLEGRTGRIGGGTSVPVTRRSLLDVDTTWVTAESGFEARPRILGDGRVLVELQPVESSVDARGRVRFSGAATTLTLRPGETVAIGAIDRSSTTRATGSRVLAASQETRESRILLLGVEVEGAE
jgi:type II secretory pathway component HofQ